jgi:hypothetical protein
LTLSGGVSGLGMEGGFFFANPNTDLGYDGNLQIVIVGQGGNAGVELVFCRWHGCCAGAPKLSESKSMVGQGTSLGPVLVGHWPQFEDQTSTINEIFLPNPPLI